MGAIYYCQVGNNPGPAVSRAGRATAPPGTWREESHPGALPVRAVCRPPDEEPRADRRHGREILSAVFGLAALFLAAAGIYGVLAFMVAHRTKEIGIRMAVGGSPEGISRMILSPE